MTGPTITPADTIEETLGPAFPLWRRLVTEVERMGGRGEWVWGGPKYGWSWRVRRGGKPFVSMTPNPGGFRALVVLGHADAVAAASLPLGAAMRATFEAARQYPDGRWLFHPVESAGDVDDVVRLLRLKVPPTVRARLEAGEQPA